MDPQGLLDAARRGMDAYVGDLERLVNQDSGSWDAEGVDAVGRWCAGRLDALGFAVDVLGTDPVDGRSLGRAVLGRRPGRADRPTLLLMGHMDTVFGPGEAGRRPFAVTDGIASGPGVCDDKGGLLGGLLALSLLAGGEGLGELRVLCSPDEELGSRAGRAVIERAGEGVDAALCLECAREDGRFVTARHGLAELRVDITGRAAHAGIEPERGIDAALAAARLLDDVAALDGRRPDTRVNVGVIRAGERVNVICPSATLELEVRSASAAGFQETLAEVERLAGALRVPGASARVERVAQHPPMERTAAVGRLADRALALAADYGIATAEAATPGTADVNLLTAMGIPAIDGLGPVGGGDHGPDEWIALDSVAPRAAWLAALIADVGGMA